MFAAVTGLDWIIVAFAVLLAVYGALQGFIVGVLSLAGFAAGAVVGSRLAPLVLHGGARSPYAPVLGLAGALLVGGLLAAGLGGLGERARLRMPAGPLIGADAVLGAALGAAMALAVVWVAGAVALQTPGARQLRHDVQRSGVLRWLNDRLPPSGVILHALARFDPVPRIAGPEAAVPPPRAAIARRPAVRAAGASVVRVVGSACGLGLEGSGWIARPGLVVTNAHVVAGEDDTQVQVDGRAPGLDAQPVLFDPRNDVAVLRVAGLTRRALPLASHPRSGTSAAIMGYPENGPFRIRAGRIGRTQTVISNDAYGRGPIRRRMTPLRGTVLSGNSGGPMVDARGRVVTTVFAATTSGPRGGFGVPNEVVSRALRRAGGPVDTGPCAG
jgi:S1-C subfamily serine protease